MALPIQVNFFDTTSLLAAVLSALAAIFSGFCAFFSYRLSGKIRDELKSDEKLIVSRIIHPGLAVDGQNKCVIKCNLFNKSKRKAFVNRVTAYDKKDKLMDVSWSNRTNEYGFPLSPCELIGIVDTEELFIRHNMGDEIDFCRLEIFHSFSKVPITAIFDFYGDFG